MTGDVFGKRTKDFREKVTTLRFGQIPAIFAGPGK